MGSFLSTQMTPTLPASTPSLCVLPLRTNGQARFSVASGPVPSPLTSRLADTEWQVLVESINAELLPLSHFGFMSLLLPFLLVDLLTMMLLCAIDPWLLLSPWDYGFAELLLPISLELALVFCGFPLMVHIVNRRMAAVQSRVRALLDTASRQLGSRGVNFQLKQAILGNGAGTNLWVEVQVMPLTQVFVPVPVPAPSLYPILLPAATPAGPATTPAATPAHAGAASAGATGAAAADAAAEAAEGVTREQMAAAAAAAGATGTMAPLQLEYLRVLQENQMLRQYLKQTQQLVQLQAQHSRALAMAGVQQQAFGTAAPVDLNAGAGA